MRDFTSQIHKRTERGGGGTVEPSGESEGEGEGEGDGKGGRKCFDDVTSSG